MTNEIKQCSEGRGRAFESRRVRQLFDIIQSLSRMAILGKHATSGKLPVYC